MLLSFSFLLTIWFPPPPSPPHPPHTHLRQPCWDRTMALFYNYIYLKQLSNHNTGSAETFCLRKKRRQRLNRTLKYINIYFPTADINLGFRQHFTSVSSKYLKSFSFRLPTVPRPVFCPRTTPLLCVLHSQTALYWQMAFDDRVFQTNQKSITQTLADDSRLSRNVFYIFFLQSPAKTTIM